MNKCTVQTINPNCVRLVPCTLHVCRMTFWAACRRSRRLNWRSCERLSPLSPSHKLLHKLLAAHCVGCTGSCQLGGVETAARSDSCTVSRHSARSAVTVRSQTGQSGGTACMVCSSCSRGARRPALQGLGGMARSPVHYSAPTSQFSLNLPEPPPRS